MNLTRDKDIPKGSEGLFGEFAGKLQPSVKGDLIEVEYSVFIIWDCAGCLCAPNPFVFNPIKVLAPGTEIVIGSDSDEDEEDSSQKDESISNANKDENKDETNLGVLADHGKGLETSHNLGAKKDQTISSAKSKSKVAPA